MKPRFLSPYPIVFGLMMCLGAGYSFAGDFHIHIPNPIPKIVRSVERVGNKVGNAVGRVVERVEEDSADTRRDPNRRPSDELVDPALVPVEPVLSPDGRPLHYQSSPDGRPLPYRSTTTTVEIRRGPISDPALIDGRQPMENPRLREGVANPQPAPSNTASYSAVQRPSTPSVRPAPPPSATADTKRIDTTTLPGQGAPVTPPASAPDIKFAKRVPNHPGLVYPPGVEEIPVNMLDVQGMAPGTKVRNPATGAVFRVP